MHKLIAWCNEHLLFLLSLVLLAFIPLYPKLPLIDIKNTWVYIRAEDFVVLSVFLIFIAKMFKGSVSLKTPLTMPIMAFWIAGIIATVHGVLIIFPTVANVFPNVAMLSLIRRVEYMSVFFVGFWGMRQRKYLPWVTGVLLCTVLAVTLYGLGQKFAGFPAFLTMNEEFAKGIPLRLSSLSRIPSTFAGHYDLAAYYVLALPVLVSLVFPVTGFLVRFVLLGTVLLGSYVLFLTVSRISLIALIVSVGIVLLYQKKRLILFLIPVALIAGLVFIRINPKIFERFTSTVQTVDVLLDAKTGMPIGNVSILPKTVLQGKNVRHLITENDIGFSMKTNEIASFSGVLMPYEFIPPEIAMLASARLPTGEDLPHGTGYINLPLSPVIRGVNQFYYMLKEKDGSETDNVQIAGGNYLIKKTLAYDLSFTTRFQGEWPNTVAAFKRNIFLGSGYGSVSLAVDNSYLRMLGEVGIIGTAAFFALFVIFILYALHVWKNVDSSFDRSFIVGVAAGIAGLFVNAFFIDVFEASKIAFSLWLIIGLSIGLLSGYQKKPFDWDEKLKRLVFSPAAIISYIIIAVYSLFGSMAGNYFVGDDFTWLKWASQCPHPPGFFGRCDISGNTVIEYFTNAAGFFYRPGTKLYFLAMYSTFWLNQNVYHLVSLTLHGIASILVFLLSRRVFNDSRKSGLTALLFLIIAGYSEAVFWISATGHLITTCAIFAAAVLTMRYHETHRIGYLIFATVFHVIAPMFHELGIVSPLFAAAYLLILTDGWTVRTVFRRLWAVFIIPVVIYIALRYGAGSHWFNGDYSYNLVKLPVNFIGNLIGYGMVTAAGPMLLSVYESFRSVMRVHPAVTSALLLAALALGYPLMKKYGKLLAPSESRIVVYSMAVFVISLLPFLGLGNITVRYGYTATFATSILIVLGLSRMYRSLVLNGREIAQAGLAMLMGVFILFHLVQMQKLQDNWKEAGDTVRKFLVSVESYYIDSWKTDPMEFHFVNVPLKRGDAWVFPVGLPDAMWFAFENPAIRVFQYTNLDDALDQVSYGNPTQKVFVFESDGSVVYHAKTRK